MNVIVKNVGKIKFADIKFDGITVIAGKNNTGKSTVSEIVASFFLSLSDIERKVFFYKLREIRNIFSSICTDISKRRLFTMRRSEIDNAITIFLDDKDKELDIFIDSVLALLNVEECDKKNLHSAINEVLGYKDEDISRIELGSCIAETLNGKENSFYTNEQAEITFTIKNIENKILFSANEISECSIKSHILNNATYINNPFSLDKINAGIGFQLNTFSFIENNLIYKLKNKVTSEYSDDNTLWNNNDPIAKLRNNKLLQNILTKMNEILPGKIIFNDNYVYKMENKDINISSLSTGIKSFALIKQLIENNQLNEKDVLILDEPEIHLHPEWQLIYAELIVLLQKEYNLTVLITTHSSTFLEAIDLFSRKNKTDNNCNYYISQPADVKNMVTFEDVTNHLDIVYKELVTPTMTLMKLREELEDENDKL